MTDEPLNEEMLRNLAIRTAALPREIVPPAGAWDGIKAAIDAERTVPITRVSHVWWQRPAYLAAAALLLVAGSSAITAIALNGKAGSEGRSAASAAPERPSAATATLAEFTRVENDYIETANHLTQVLESDKVQLAPETVEKLKESLRVIDAAILEAREALAHDPMNKTLMEMLSASYSQKVDLLKRTTAMGET